jgi:hypothetical protein
MATEVKLSWFEEHPDIPPVPRGFKTWMESDGRIYTCSPPDKRKRRNRVPEEPRKFWLLKNDKDELVWIREGAHRTEGIREFMIEQALRMEVLYGIRATMKAPKMTTILREEYGMTGKPLALYMQFCRFKRQNIHPKMAEKALAAGEIT